MWSTLDENSKRSLAQQLIQLTAEIYSSQKALFLRCSYTLSILILKVSDYINSNLFVQLIVTNPWSFPFTHLYCRLHHSDFQYCLLCFLWYQLGLDFCLKRWYLCFCKICIWQSQKQAVPENLENFEIAIYEQFQQTLDSTSGLSAVLHLFKVAYNQ